MTAKGMSESDRGVLSRLVQAGDVAYRLKRNTLAQVGISALESEVLLMLNGAEGPIDTPSLSRRMLLEPRALRSLLRRMESKGLVSLCKSGPEKNATQAVEATEEGHLAYSKSLELNNMYGVLSCLSSEEKEQLEVLLRKLLRTSLSTLGIGRLFHHAELVGEVPPPTRRRESRARAARSGRGQSPESTLCRQQ